MKNNLIGNMFTFFVILLLTDCACMYEYNASHIDLASDNPLNNAELYSIVDALELLWNKFAEVFFETDPKIKVVKCSQ